jgi:hypothetical protein
MNDSINYTCYRKDTSNNSTDMYQEVKEVLSILIELYCDWREFIIEHNDIVSRIIISLIVGCELEHIIVIRSCILEV